MEDPQAGFQAFHTTWTAVITVAGAVVAFFTKRTFDQLDAKADQSEMDELKQDIKAFIAQQALQHSGNTERLDRIIMELGRKDR